LTTQLEAAFGRPFFLRPLIVGLDNPHSADPRLALWPYPRGCAGARLADLADLSPRAYLRAFDRANACDLDRASFWPSQEPGRTVILLGRAVAKWAGMPAAPFWQPLSHAGCAVLVIPHPSGRCLLYNDPEARAQARAILRQAVSAAVP
jgi:hypothetical protein